MASMIRFTTTIKVGNPRLTRRCVRSSVEFYTLRPSRNYPETSQLLVIIASICLNVRNFGEISRTNFFSIASPKSS